MTSVRRSIPPHRRVWGAAVVAVALGAMVYLAMAYRVLQAGGLTVSSLRGACAEAATGGARTSYRVSEDVDVEHTFLPLSATCRWSGGTSAELVGASGWSWLGPVLVVAGVGVLVGLQVYERRR